MKLIFRPYQKEDKSALTTLIMGLYAADAAGEEMTSDKIEKTVHALSGDSPAGKILMVLDERTPIGYALLIRYWSNEYGGWLVFIDELFITESHRGQGAGSSFIHFITTQYFKDVQAFALEVMPSNHQALALYQRLGFIIDGRNHLFLYPVAHPPE